MAIKYIVINILYYLNVDKKITKLNTINNTKIRDYYSF